jgi:hypothetical protein
MPGQPISRFRRIHALSQRGTDLANEVYAASPERCKWDQPDYTGEHPDSDVIGRAWEDAIKCAVELAFALEELADVAKRRQKVRLDAEPPVLREK